MPFPSYRKYKPKLNFNIEQSFQGWTIEKEKNRSSITNYKVFGSL